MVDFNNKAYFKVGECVIGPAAKELILETGLLDPHWKTEPSLILDNGCGSGVVAALLFQSLEEDVKSSMRLMCTDSSEQSVKAIRERMKANGWKGVEARISNAEKLDFPDNYFDYVFSNFLLQLLPDPEAAISEVFRVLKPGGICGFTTWDSVGQRPDCYAAVSKYIPDAPPFPSQKEILVLMGNTRAFHAPGTITRLLERPQPFVAFVDVKAKTFIRKIKFDNPKVFAEEFGGPVVKSVVSKLWSETEKELLVKEIDGAVEKYVTDKNGDGMVEAEMIAIVATAKKPYPTTITIPRSLVVVTSLAVAAVVGYTRS